MSKKTTARSPARSASKADVPPPAARFFVEVVAEGERKGSVDDTKLRVTRRVLFLARRWRNLMDEALRSSGHSHARWITLLWVDLLDGRANHRELAERVGVELPTLIRLLNRLEKEGLVKRHSLPDRGLSKSVMLTKRGEKTLAVMSVVVRQTRADFTSGVDKKQLVAGLELLDALLEKLATVLDWTDRQPKVRRPRSRRDSA